MTGNKLKIDWNKFIGNMSICVKIGTWVSRQRAPCCEYLAPPLPARPSLVYVGAWEKRQRTRGLSSAYQSYSHGSWRGPKLKKTPIFLLMPNSHKLRKDSKKLNFKIGSWGPKKLSQIFNMPIIKSVARKGQNTPKSDFRGPKIPPRGASSTWNM